MDADEFRSLALALPESAEDEHMHHPDFRVGGKIFATLGRPGDGWGMVKLSPAEQADAIRAHPHVFEPFAGAWGRRGATKVLLAAADAPMVAPALAAAWRNTAPKRLRAKLG